MKTTINLELTRDEFKLLKSTLQKSLRSENFNIEWMVQNKKDEKLISNAEEKYSQLSKLVEDIEKF